MKSDHGVRPLTTPVFYIEHAEGEGAVSALRIGFHFFVIKIFYSERLGKCFLNYRTIF